MARKVYGVRSFEFHCKSVFAVGRSAVNVLQEKIKEDENFLANKSTEEVFEWMLTQKIYTLKEDKKVFLQEGFDVHFINTPQENCQPKMEVKMKKAWSYDWSGSRGKWQEPNQFEETQGRWNRYFTFAIIEAMKNGLNPEEKVIRPLATINGYRANLMQVNHVFCRPIEEQFQYSKEEDFLVNEIIRTQKEVISKILSLPKFTVGLEEVRKMDREVDSLIQANQEAFKKYTTFMMNMRENKLSNLNFIDPKEIIENAENEKPEKIRSKKKVKTSKEEVKIEVKKEPEKIESPEEPVNNKASKEETKIEAKVETVESPETEEKAEDKKEPEKIESPEEPENTEVSEEEEIWERNLKDAEKSVKHCEGRIKETEEEVLSLEKKLECRSKLKNFTESQKIRLIRKIKREKHWLSYLTKVRLVKSKENLEKAKIKLEEVKNSKKDKKPEKNWRIYRFFGKGNYTRDQINWFEEGQPKYEKLIKEKNDEFEKNWKIVQSIETKDEEDIEGQIKSLGYRLKAAKAKLEAQKLEVESVRGLLKVGLAHPQDITDRNSGIFESEDIIKGLEESLEYWKNKREAKNNEASKEEVKIEAKVETVESPKTEEKVETVETKNEKDPEKEKLIERLDRLEDLLKEVKKEIKDIKKALARKEENKAESLKLKEKAIEKIEAYKLKQNKKVEAKKSEGVKPNIKSPEAPKTEEKVEAKKEAENKCPSAKSVRRWLKDHKLVSKFLINELRTAIIKKDMEVGKQIEEDLKDNELKIASLKVMLKKYKENEKLVYNNT